MSTFAYAFLMVAGAAATLRRMDFDFDLIDAHYYYPDGVTAAILGALVGRPVVITARGTDLNLYPSQFPLVRRLMTWAARRAFASIAVSSALAQALVAMGAPDERVFVLRNGVDLDRFKLVDHMIAQRSLDMHGPIVLSVGNLVSLKGHDIVIRCMELLPDHQLLIIGEGPDRPALEALASSLKLASRVTFLGAKNHDDLPRLYGAADVLVLASEREGWPNVLLEALACGTPVVATNVGGVPETMRSPTAGRIVPERSPAAIAAATKALHASPPSRSAVRQYAEAFSWDSTTQGQLQLFKAAAAARRASADH